MTDISTGRYIGNLVPARKAWAGEADTTWCEALFSNLPSWRALREKNKIFTNDVLKLKISWKVQGQVWWSRKILWIHFGTHYGDSFSPKIRSSDESGGVNRKLFLNTTVSYMVRSTLLQLAFLACPSGKNQDFHKRCAKTQNFLKITGSSLMIKENCC